MRILVTGGGGFIGSHLVEALLAAEHEVRVVDRDPATVVEGAELIRADLGAPGVAERAVAGMDAVSHHAARVGLGRDFSDAPAYVADNDLVTARLLAALAAVGFTGRFVLASSMVVYGESPYRCTVDGRTRPAPRHRRDLQEGRFEPRCGICGRVLSWELVDEDDPLDPRSVYAATKVAQEHLVGVWARETNVSAVALRYHNVYGPRLPLDTPYAGVAAIFRSALRKGESPLVFEDGNQARDFVHVRDVAAANVAAIDVPAPGASMLPVNVCSGSPVTIGGVASTLADVFGPGAPRPVVTGRYRMGDVRHVVAAAKRAKSQLGFEARIPLREGLAELAAECIPP